MVTGYQLGLYPKSLHTPLKTSTVSPACPVGTVELAAPDTTIAFVTNVTALSDPNSSHTHTHTHSHEVIVISDESNRSVIEALGGPEGTDGSVYERSSDEEDTSEAASVISMSILDGNPDFVFGAAQQDAEPSDDTGKSNCLI